MFITAQQWVYLCGIFQADVGALCQADVMFIRLKCQAGQQYSSELEILCSAFPRALLAQALCHANCGSALELIYTQLAGSVMRVYNKHNVDFPSRLIQYLFLSPTA